MTDLRDAGPVDLILVGGGHTNVQVMTAFARQPEPRLRLTLVTDRLTTPYSGMLPGCVAGLYAVEEMHIDLARLARATGTRLIHAAAIGLDRPGKRLLLADGAMVSYDLLSLNVGIAPDLSGIEGADRHGIPVKPISGFLTRLDALLKALQKPDGPRRIAIVGGGAAGVELAFAMRARLNREAPGWGIDPASFDLVLASAEGLVPALNDSVRRKVEAALARHRIGFVSDFRVVAITARSLRAQDGRELPADAVLLSTDARAPSWLAGTGLPLAKDGSVETRETLQALGDDAIFAVGDCATVVADPRPKAGVFAVRQGPALVRGLRAVLGGEPIPRHQPQREFLTLLMTGDGSAIAGRGTWFSLEGRLVWRWKDWIDRRFMAMFSEFDRDRTP
jgi:pyridine nucleotide-disulfide oxidoreductase family protein